MVNGLGLVRVDYRELLTEAHRLFLNIDAVVLRSQIPCLRGCLELLRAGVHQLQGATDGEGGDHDADQERIAL